MSKTILITGTSSGIGKATAQYFQLQGWNVVATMRTPEKAGDWVKHSKTLCARLDVLDEVSIRRAVEAAWQRFGTLDVVVNNAGYGLVGPFEAATGEAIERQFRTNVFGVMNVCRAVIPYFRERGGGTIINVASMGGRITFPLYSLYHGTKWAVEGFSEALQYELAQFNIRVKIVEPGPIKTDFYDRSMEVISQPGLTAYDAYVKQTMPNMQKAGETAPGGEAVAKVIFKAATDGSRKMRYPANSARILLARKLLPDFVFFSIVRSAVEK